MGYKRTTFVDERVLIDLVAGQDLYLEIAVTRTETGAPFSFADWDPDGFLMQLGTDAEMDDAPQPLPTLDGGTLTLDCAVELAGQPETGLLIATLGGSWVWDIQELTAQRRGRADLFGRYAGRNILVMPALWRLQTTATRSLVLSTAFGSGTIDAPDNLPIGSVA